MYQKIGPNSREKNRAYFVDSDEYPARKGKVKPCGSAVSSTCSISMNSCFETR
jgi:hypothetical protein